jgi:Fe-S oxidoreductase
MAQSLFGIDRRRTLPALAPRTLHQHLAPRTLHQHLAPGISTEHPAPSTGHRVVLFTDTFTTFCHPEIGTAAVDVLRAAGNEVHLVPHACCGRPLISQGLLEEARALAARNASALSDVAERGDAIVFLEPSCLSAIKEDAPSLLRGEQQRRASMVAGAAVLFEDFVERQWQGGPNKLTLADGPHTILLHGHCHQKAMGLMPSARALLARIPRSTVVDLEAGCCGMAGSFGYAREHYDVSRTIGERRLLPAARDMKPGAALVAAGTSCREQVAHFTGVSPLHPAQLLASLLK